VRRHWLWVAALASGCSVTPIMSKITPGEDPFVMVVGEGSDAATDLFVAPAAGGEFTRLTFTRPAEELPELAPEGRRVAFFRRYDDGHLELVVLNLLTMGEIRVVPPSSLRHPIRLGWSPGGDSLAIADSTGLYLATPGAGSAAITPASGARLDSLTWERLGQPEFASIRPCRASAGFCAVADTVETALGSRVRDPIRWGPDALGYVRDGRLEIRPLGGGSPDHPKWSSVPGNLRQPTHHPGSRSAGD